jgi:AraC-like DNA-binding protein
MEQLITALSVTRQKFLMESFIGTDNIFALVESGSFYMESNDGAYTVGAGEGACFRQNILYQRKVISPVKMYLFRYASERVIFASDHIVFSDKTRILSTLNLLNTLDKDIFKDDFEKRRHIFNDLILQYETENEISPCDDPIIENAIVLIKNNFQNKLCLNEIGKKSGLSYVQFLRRFKAYSGLTPAEYVKALRLQKAKDLLTNTKLQIRQIAYSCGFENEYYFSNFFKKQTGISPTSFRNYPI